MLSVRSVQQHAFSTRWLSTGPSIFEMLKRAASQGQAHAEQQKQQQQQQQQVAKPLSLMDMLQKTNPVAQPVEPLRFDLKEKEAEDDGEANSAQSIDVFSKLRGLLDMDDTANENEDLSEKMQSLVSSMRDFREKQEDSGVLIRNAKRNEPRLTLSQKLKNAGLYHERETFESSDIYKSQFANRELEMPAYLSNTSARKKILEGYRNEKDALEVAWDRLTLLDRRAPPVRYLKLSNKKRVRLPRKLTLEHALLELYIRSELMEREGDDHKKIKILPTMPIKEVSRALSVTEYDLRQVVLALGREIPQIDTFHMLAHEVETVCKYLDHPYEFGEFKKADIKPSNYTHGADRPPVVTVMGHVNHGKTTLLDTFRKKKVAPIEVGGITQSVASFTVRFKGKHPITFFDTPGHSVFSTMRKNVAKVTDLVIIIIAANEGLQSQTLDSIKTAQAYGIPILVAVNKCDLVGKDIDTQILSIKEQLAGAGVELEDMGGDVQVVKISAKTGSGLDELEDSILLAAEMLELKAPIDVPAQALIVETRTDPGMGHIVLAVVKHGILKLKDNIVSGEFKGVVRNMYDWDGTPVKEAGPSIPVLIKGLEGTPAVGDFINVVDTSKKARDVVHVRQAHNIDESDNAPVETKIEDPDQAKKELSVIVKANLSGSLQSLLDYLSRVPNTDVNFRIIRSAVGEISLQDLELAKQSNARVVGFNVSVSQHGKKFLKDHPQIKVNTSKLIYELLDPLCQEYLELIPDQFVELKSGKATIKKVFNITVDKKKQQNIAGCGVIEGRFEKTELTKVRVYRNDRLICEDILEELRVQKEIATSVSKGFECGVRLKSFGEFKVGDELECITLTKVPKTIDWVTEMVEKSRLRDPKYTSI